MRWRSPGQSQTWIPQEASERTPDGTDRTSSSLLVWEGPELAKNDMSFTADIPLISALVMLVWGQLAALSERSSHQATVCKCAAVVLNSEAACTVLLDNHSRP